MAKIKISLDLRREMKDGAYPVKLLVTHKSTFRIGTDFSALKEEWDSNQYNKNATNYKAKNIMLRGILNKAEAVVLKLEEEDKLHSTTDKKLKSSIENVINRNSVDKKLFIDHLKDFISLKNNSRTKEIYLDTKNKVENFDSCARIEEMDVNWLKKFENYMILDGIRTNTIAIHLRNIRAVFNYALDEEIINAYPFRRYKIKKEETIKRSMSIDDLRKLRDYECEPHQERYRDLFMLTFYLIGINPIDLLHLKEIKNGRIEYYRAKTGKLYSVEVLPEAMDIINKYKGENYLINVLDSYVDYKHFTSKMNKNLKQIGEFERVGLGGKKIRKPLFPDITIYHARHSWATVASNLDIPKETISAALGHEIGSKITGIYINFDMKKVDDANKKIIDYLFERKKT